MDEDAILMIDLRHSTTESNALHNFFGHCSESNVPCKICQQQPHLNKNLEVGNNENPSTNQLHNSIKHLCAQNSDMSKQLFQHSQTVLNSVLEIVKNCQTGGSAKGSDVSTAELENLMRKVETSLENRNFDAEIMETHQKKIIRECLEEILTEMEKKEKRSQSPEWSDVLTSLVRAVASQESKSEVEKFEKLMLPQLRTVSNDINNIKKLVEAFVQSTAEDLQKQFFDGGLSLLSSPHLSSPLLPESPLLSHLLPSSQEAKTLKKKNPLSSKVPIASKKLESRGVSTADGDLKKKQQAAASKLLREKAPANIRPLPLAERLSRPTKASSAAHHIPGRAKGEETHPKKAPVSATPPSVSSTQNGLRPRVSAKAVPSAERRVTAVNTEKLTGQTRISGQSVQTTPRRSSEEANGEAKEKKTETRDGTTEDREESGIELKSLREALWKNKEKSRERSKSRISDDHSRFQEVIELYGTGREGEGIEGRGEERESERGEEERKKERGREKTRGMRKGESQEERGTRRLEESANNFLFDASEKLHAYQNLMHEVDMTVERARQDIETAEYATNRIREQRREDLLERSQQNIQKQFEEIDAEMKRERILMRQKWIEKGKLMKSVSDPSPKDNLVSPSKNLREQSTSPLAVSKVDVSPEQDISLHPNITLTISHHQPEYWKRIKVKYPEIFNPPLPN